MSVNDCQRPTNMVVACPKCGKCTTYRNYTYVIDFYENGEGRYGTDMSCYCGHNFKKYYRFKYTIIEEK